MSSTEAQKRASVKYNRKQDNLMCRPSKEEGQKIRNAAQAAGMSVQAYMLEAVREKMSRDGGSLESVPDAPDKP